MKISGWGNYPIFDTNIFYPKNITEIINHINSGTLIARGNGRSYGDSSINVNKTLSTKYLNKIFNQFLIVAMSIELFLLVNISKNEFF